MSGELVLFLICAFFGLLTAFATVTVSNPIRAAMALLGHIVLLAALYVGLNAHLMAALQIIVYAGAVVVLFVFVIMMIGAVPRPAGEDPSLLSKTVGITLMSILGMGVAFILLGFQPEAPAIASCPPGTAECAQFGGVVAVARELYVDAVVPFELISVLLLVAIVGAIAVARGRNAAEAAQSRAAEGAAAATGDGN